jgi:hypothetical protein
LGSLAPRRLAKGHGFDDLAQLHERREMEGLDKVAVGPQGEGFRPLPGISGAGDDHDANLRAVGDGFDMPQQLFAIALGQMEIQQNNGGRPQVFLLRELVKDRKRLSAIVDDLEHVGQLMGIEHPADEVDVHRIIVHKNNGQRQRGSLHDGHFSVGAVRASHTAPWATQASIPA